MEREYVKNKVGGEVPCSDHPDAPHGFNRNGSHNNDRYTCECEGWEEEMRLINLGELKMEREYVRNKQGGNDCYAYHIPSSEVEQVLKELLEEENPSTYHWAIIKTQRNDNLEKDND